MKKDWGKYDKKTKYDEERIDIVEILLNYVLSPILVIFIGLGKFIKDVFIKFYWILVAAVATGLFVFLMKYLEKK